MVAVAVYLPALNEPLGTVPLGASELGLAALLALLPFACVEAGKAVFRRAGWTLGPGAAARHGAATIIGFVTAGTVPAPRLSRPVIGGGALPTAIVLTLATLFAVGASRALVTRLGWLRSGLEMLAVGALAAAVAYAIGALASTLTA